MILTIAILVFAFILVLVIGIWWVSQADRTVRERLKQPGRGTGGPDLLRPDQDAMGSLAGAFRNTGLPQRLGKLLPFDVLSADAVLTPQPKPRGAL